MTWKERIKLLWKILNEKPTPLALVFTIFTSISIAPLIIAASAPTSSIILPTMALYASSVAIAGLFAAVVFLILRVYHFLQSSFVDVSKVTIFELAQQYRLSAKYFTLSILVSITFFYLAYLVPLGVLASAFPALRPFESLVKQVLASPFSPGSYLFDPQVLVTVLSFPLLGSTSILVLRLVSNKKTKTGEGTMKVLSILIITALITVGYSAYNNPIVESAPTLHVVDFATTYALLFIIPYSIVSALMILLIEWAVRPYLDSREKQIPTA